MPSSGLVKKSGINLYIAFNSDDIQLFESVKSEEDIILAYGDISTSSCTDATSLSNIDFSLHTPAVRELFDDVSKQCLADLKGFSNNAFECSIRPMLRYLQALRLIIDEQEVSNIVFAKKNLLFKGQVNYYMAEHESQGNILYSRRASMQADIVRFAHENKCSVVYLKRAISAYKVNTLIRDCSIFGFRLINDLKKSLSKSTPHINNHYDVVFIVRTRVQFDFIRPLINTSNLNIAIYCGSSSMQNGVFEFVNSIYQECSNVSVVSLQSVGLLSVFIRYLSVIPKYLFLKQIIYSSNGFKINLTQALREILIMSPEVFIYRGSLIKSIEKKQSGSNGVLFSCEQKSPHAYIDASVARLKGYQPVQIMCCDQEKNDLPYPVFSNHYLTDTLSRLELFKSSWSTSVNKLAYEGCIKLLSLNEKISAIKEEEYKYCYFSHVSELEQNIKVIELLKRICNAKNTRFCIKLHPRDNGDWLNSLSLGQGVVIKHGELEQGELFSSFEVGISNPSAVVMDLLCNKKKFIFLDTLKSYNSIDYVYVDSLYIGLVTSFSSLENVCKNNLVKDKDVLSLLERVFGEKNDDFNLTAYVNKLID